MTAGNQTPPGGRSDAPTGPGQAPEDDSPAEPIPPVVSARVTLLPQDTHAPATPPGSMPPGGGQGADGGPSELFDPSRPAGRTRPPGPADRFPASQLFEPFTPVSPTGPSTASGSVPGPTVPWSPVTEEAVPPGAAVPATPPTEALSTEALSTEALSTEALPTTGPSGTAASASAPSADAVSATGPANAVTPASTGERAPGDDDTPAYRSLGDAQATPPEAATASPQTPPPGAPPPHSGPQAARSAPPSVPARMPMQPRRSAGRPSTPPPAPAAPAATGRLRRLPVTLLVVAVLLAGLGYAGYRQLTGGPPDGFRAATAPGYELAVPETWTPPAPGTPPLTVFGVPFGTAGQYGGYGCEDGRFTRAVAASALIAVPPNVGLDQAATAFARGAGEALYPGAGPQVAVGTPSDRQLSTVTGSRVEATVRTDGSAGCRATDATVQVLVMPRTTAADGSIGAAVLLVSGDLRGGPPNPAPLSRDELVGVLDTAELSSG